MSKSKDFRKRLQARLAAQAPPDDGVNPVVEELRRRMEKIRAKRAPRKHSAPIVYRRDVPHHKSRPPRPVAYEGPPVDLEEAAHGIETQSSGGGRAYIVETRLAGLDDSWLAMCEGFRLGFSRADTKAHRILSSVAEARELAAEDVLFLDLETTGLGSTPVFLIGTMTWDAGDFVVRQYLARDYSEERAILLLFAADAAAKKVLVTFNGKSYDVPYLRMRSAATLVEFRVPGAHFDLLHASRRAWRDELPDCKLKTLETHVCARQRGEDIAGAQIPDVYHAFVRTGNAAGIAEILRHNLLDLATLADILLRLPAPAKEQTEKTE